ncbi:hypothetical protein Emag_002037 [Eimeria magna]
MTRHPSLCFGRLLGPPSAPAVCQEQQQQQYEQEQQQPQPKDMLAAAAGFVGLHIFGGDTAAAAAAAAAGAEADAVAAAATAAGEVVRVDGTPPPSSSKWERHLLYNYGLYDPRRLHAEKSPKEIENNVARFKQTLDAVDPKDACKYLQLEEYKCLQLNQAHRDPETASTKCVKWFQEWRQCNSSSCCCCCRFDRFDLGGSSSSSSSKQRLHQTQRIYCSWVLLLPLHVLRTTTPLGAAAAAAVAVAAAAAIAAAAVAAAAAAPAAAATAAAGVAAAAPAASGAAAAPLL